MRKGNATENSSLSRLQMLRGALTTGLGTLLSRLLGMLRDVATAAMLGMSAGGVMDSFVMALRLPDIARRLFGDGSLAVGFIPVFSRTWLEDRRKAWQLLSVMLTWVFFFLVGFVILGEFLCFCGFYFFEPESKIYLISHLLSLLLPYLILICMAAITSATLQTLGNFSIPALIPAILNIVWLAGVLLIAPFCSGDPVVQCYLLTLCILLAGVFQFFIHLPILHAYGFRFHLDFSAVRVETRRIFDGFFPQIFGLMSMQLNILVASGIAWLFSGPPGGTVRWLAGLVEYPLASGAAAAIYYSERLHEFPQGLIGLTMATAIYPLLSRHAAQKDFRSLGDDLTLGARILFVLAIPAGVGLMLMSEKLAHLLFHRGAFTTDDMFRTAGMVFWFAAGVWAFCALPLIVRAFYVVGDYWTPCRVGFFGCFFNAVLGLLLIWPMKEQGLALAASLAAGGQSVALFLLFARKYGYFDFRSFFLSIGRAGIASCLMAVAVAMTMKMLPGQDSLSDVIHIVSGTVIGAFVFFTVHRILGGRELGILIRGRERKKEPTEIKRRRRSNGREA